MEEIPDNIKAALIFGASGEQGRAVLESFVDAGYSPVYGFTSSREAVQDQYLSDALQCIILEGRLGNPEDVRKALVGTKAQTIFLATTTEMPVVEGAGYSYKSSHDEEYECIISFFTILKQVYQEDGLSRTVVFSTQENVDDLCRNHLEETGGADILIEPLDDGSIVPHFSAKGKGGEKALELLREIPELHLILITPAFFYSNFLAFFAPLPNEGKTQWELTASFGHGSNKIDMMNASDLGRIVVGVAADGKKYDGQNLRLASERISMDEIASQFSDLFGKDVIYNPLLPSELAALDFATAPVQAQMCQFLASKAKVLKIEHDIDLTAALLSPRHPSNFTSWLLTHSDGSAFSRVGLDLDTPELTNICVFDALSPQGQNVVKGLLADTRKSYQIRCTTRHSLNDFEVNEMIRLDPHRVSFVEAKLDDVDSCRAALSGMNGAFLVSDLQESSESSDPENEERQVRNIIDAGEGQVRHLIISTMEAIENVNNDLPHRDLLELSPKARLAAYARSRNMSVTFVLLPCYSETFFEIGDVRSEFDGKGRGILTLPATGHDPKRMCMSIDELGPAVANIFDSYQCFAGHEIGLLTDFVAVSDVDEILQDPSSEHKVEADPLGTKDWIEATDTYMKDLGQLFAGVSDSQAVSGRHSIAESLKLVPMASNLKHWVAENRDNPSFLEKLGLR